MEVSVGHSIFMALTVLAVIGAGMYAARTVRSAEGYSLGGRSSGVAMVAGGIAGTAVGGGATVGTAQMAYTLGMTAWWFTLGMGVSFIILGLFYARPLRGTALETIPQYLVLHYGRPAGVLSSVVSSLGSLFSAVASALPGIGILAAVLGMPAWQAAALLIVLVTAYVFFGGMRSAGIGGMLKMGILWTSLFAAGAYACWRLLRFVPDTAAMPDFPWFSLFGGGVSEAWANLLAVIVGVVCTQTYIQTLFAAASPRVAAVGAFAAALIVIPVGLPCIAIGMYMHLAEPGLPPLLVLPTYLLHYQPAWIGGVAMGGIMLSVIGSIAGISLGISTMVSRDILAGLFAIRDNRALLRLNRLVLLGIMLLACVVAMLNPDSQVLFWNYMSMALRGGGIFLPLTLAVFLPHKLDPRWAAASMLLSTFVAVGAACLALPVQPLLVGLAASFLLILPGLWGKKASAVPKAVDEDSAE
jgi:solute:Na+ symporter, SSS family